MLTFAIGEGREGKKQNTEGSGESQGGLVGFNVYMQGLVGCGLESADLGQYLRTAELLAR